MSRKILILNGNPDPSPERFSAALVEAYLREASLAGHQVRRIDIGALTYPILRSQAEFMTIEPVPDILAAQESVTWADHLVIVFPLWLGGAPALLKGFLEQVFRYGFAINGPREPAKQLLAGRSARLIVTMGMPAPIFRWVFGGHGLFALERGILWLSGVRPIDHLVIGKVDGSPERRSRWLEVVGRLGANGA